MKKSFGWLCVGLAMMILLGCGDKKARTVTPNRWNEVAVWVDQVGITGVQIQMEASRLFSSVPASVPAEQIPAIQLRLLNQAVDNLVIRTLVRSAMEREGTIITREEIEKGKKGIEASMGPGGSLTILLAQVNLPMEELEANLKLDIFKNKMTQKELKVALDAVTEETAREYFDANAAEFTQPAGRSVSHILVRVQADASAEMKEDAREKIGNIRQALLEGADFAKLATEVSDCASRERGGLLGTVPRGREDAAFDEAVYSQEFGAIGEIVQTPVGYHVIRVAGDQEAQVVPFDVVQEQLLAALKAQAQKKIYDGYIQALREKATIKFDGALADFAKPAPDAAPAEASAPAEAAVEASAPEAAPVEE